MSPTAPVRVVVADDHPIWRSGLRSDLGENFHVIGEAGDAPEAIVLPLQLNQTSLERHRHRLGPIHRTELP